MYTIGKVIQLRDQAKLIGLDADNGFWVATPRQLLDCFNGAGPDWMNISGRKTCSWLLRNQLAAVLIHDWDFQNSNGKAHSFSVANERLLYNMYKINGHNYNMWYFYPIRIYANSKSFGAYLICKRYGWDAWLNGFNEEVSRITDYNRYKQGGQSGEA